MPKADYIHRGLAKAIDFLLAGMLSTVAVPFGIFAGAVYFLISDGLFAGQSLGKKLLKLKVVVLSSDGENLNCSFKDSMIRNLPFAALMILSAIPFLGILFFIIGIAYTLLELYFVFADDRGIRVGDIYAETQVIEESNG